jgi:membrane associated rhomboid family serine protease
MLTYAVMALNAAISFWAFSAFQKGRDYYKFLFVPSMAARGRNLEGFFLSQFSHADLGHLAFNMLTLFFFGPIVERHLGLHFLTIYFAAGALANLIVFLIRRGDPDYKVLGASGAVTGILFAAIVLEPGMSISLLLLPIPVPAPLFAVLYIALSTFLMSRGDVANVSHEAHVGGAATGLLLGAWLSPDGLRPLLDRFQELAR